MRHSIASTTQTCSTLNPPFGTFLSSSSTLSGSSILETILFLCPVPQLWHKSKKALDGPPLDPKAEPQTSATSFVSLFKKPHSTGILDMKWINFACQNHLLGDEHSWLQTVLVWTAGYQGRDPLPVSMTPSQVGLLESGLQLLTNEMTLKKKKVLSNTSGHEEHKWTRLMSQKQLGSKQQTWNKCCTYHTYSEINSGNWATKHVWKILYPPKSAILRIFRSLDLREWWLGP